MLRSDRAPLLVRKKKNIPSHKSRFEFSMGLASRTVLAAAAVTCGMLSQSETADAVPAFARQTGYYCSTCHTAQPELTPFGRQFKLNGYTQGGTRCGDIRKIFGNTDGTKEWSGANLAMWILPTFQTSAKPLPDAPGIGVPTNNILELQDASIFFAGQIYCNLGIFSQFSYGRNAGPAAILASSGIIPRSATPEKPRWPETTLSGVYWATITLGCRMSGTRCQLGTFHGCQQTSCLGLAPLL